jgi:hypothetical protein
VPEARIADFAVDEDLLDPPLLLVDRRMQQTERLLVGMCPIELEPEPVSGSSVCANPAASYKTPFTASTM